MSLLDARGLHGVIETRNEVGGALSQVRPTRADIDAGLDQFDDVGAILLAQRGARPVGRD